MILFSTSDKGGTGRSVTSCNVAYRRAVQGDDVCYLDFDFGSPTAGAIFSVGSVDRGASEGGLHSFLHGRAGRPREVDVWRSSDSRSLRSRPVGAGRLMLMPGDKGGGEFPASEDVVARCRDLLLRVEEEFEVVVVDLSAGRSYAAQMVLEVTAAEPLRRDVARWLVFHRWTRQHIIAAAGLVNGDRGILRTGESLGHDVGNLRDSIRFVRTAVIEPDSPKIGELTPPQEAWLRDCNRHLQELAATLGLGQSMSLGTVPLDPVLQWREQIITDSDILSTRIANPETGSAFDDLAKRLTDNTAWEGI